MAIVSTEVYHITGSSSHRLIWYKCIDHLSQEHFLGPVHINDPNYDPEVEKTKIGLQMEESLAVSEAENLLGEGDGA